MHPNTKAVLANLEARADREHQLIRGLNATQLESRRDDFLLPVGPQVGQFMHALITSMKAKVIVELGTCRGYSTVWLADAAREIEGRVLTYEYEERKQKEARANVEGAGLSAYADYQLGDATTLLPKLQSEVDFVLIDLWKELYIPCFDIIYPMLKNGAIVVADNMLFPPPARADAEKYRQHVRSRKGVESVLLPLGSGIEVTRKVG